MGGVRGVCEVAGDGPPLVLLASPLARAKTYRPTAARLAATFRVHTLEMPGSGQADRVTEGWSVGQYADWAAGFIAAAGLERPVVIGHSHGGSFGVVLTARYPDRVGALVVADATGPGPRPLAPVLVGGVIDLLLELPLVVRAWHHVAGNLIRHPRNFVRQAHDSLTLDVTADAVRVTVPTLVAWGRRTHTFPLGCGEEYARLIPGARMYVSPGGSHDWEISRADEFAAAVTAFVGETAVP